MAHIMLDASFHESPQAYALRHALRNAYGDVFVTRLWAWAMRTRNATGVISVTAADLAGIVSYTDGPPEDLLNAFVKVGLLRPQEGEPGSFYMAGWSRNAGYFQKLEQARERQRRHRQKQAEQEGKSNALCNALRNANVSGPLSLSLDLVPKGAERLRAPARAAKRKSSGKSGFERCLANIRAKDGLAGGEE